MIRLTNSNGLIVNVFLLAVAVAAVSCTATTKPATSSTNSTSTASKTASKTTTTVPAPKTEEVANIAPGLEKNILYYINQHRESKGLAPLTFNAYIGMEARTHSINMAKKRVPFGHQGMSARTKKINQKVSGLSSIAENVAHGQLSAKQVVDSWLGSPGHRRNIEGNFRFTGIGVARDQRSELYFTQIFAR